MDRLERNPIPEEVLRRAFRAMQSRLWTMIPATVHEVNLAQMTLSAQICVQGLAPQEDGTYTPLIPNFLVPDCPIVFPQGGGMRLEFPIKQNDEVLLFASSRSIDNWFANGGCQPPSEIGRMHNLSDCFALCGVRNLKRVKTIDGTKVRLINEAGDFYMAFDPTAKSMAVAASGGITLNGIQIDSAGNVSNVQSLAAIGNIATSAGEVDAKTAVKVNGTPLTVP